MPKSKQMIAMLLKEIINNNYSILRNFHIPDKILFELKTGFKITFNGRATKALAKVLDNPCNNYLNEIIIHVYMHLC